jgi:hypothetical protein
MKLRTLFRSVLAKTAIATAALGGLLLLAGAPAAKANDQDDCTRRISYTEWRYREALEQFGPKSRDARHWAHERHEAYERAARLRHEWREHHPDNDRRGYGDRR